MDLGIKGRWALVCGASQGLGLGCARALAAEGVNVVINARGAEALEAAAAQIRQDFPGVSVLTVAGDIATEAVRQKALAAAPQVDILVNNAGGPPPGDFREWNRDTWIAALDANMLTPIALIQAVVDGMAQRRFGRIVNITSGAVKAPIDILGLSNGARSGLTGFVAGVARQAQIASHNVTVNNLLPGAFDTPRLDKTMKATAQRLGVSEDDARSKRTAGIPARRFGVPDEFGAACAFLCSQWGGYINGQNILLDGGAYPGTF
jgi:3-oxoacyl-[acyl-carrier protein] reductase